MTHLHRTMSAIAFAAAMSAVPAMAQDTATSGRESHFDGVYVQAFGGLAAQGSDVPETLRFDTDGDGSYDNGVVTATGADAFSPGYCNGLALGSLPSDGCRGDKDRVEYGARVGYDRRMGNIVIGGLVEAATNDATDAVTAYSTTPAYYAIRRKVDYAISGRLRAGYTPNGGALFYVTGGASWAKLDHDFYTSNTANAFDPQRNGKGVWGWQAGGGGEIMLTDNISLGLEYLYNRYKDNKYYVEATQGTAPATNPFVLASDSTRMRASDKNFDYHSLRATVGFQF